MDDILQRLKAWTTLWNGSEEVGPFVPTSMHKGSMRSLGLTDGNDEVLHLIPPSIQQLSPIHTLLQRHLNL